MIFRLWTGSRKKENGQDAALNRIFLDEILKKLMQENVS